MQKSVALHGKEKKINPDTLGAHKQASCEQLLLITPCSFCWLRAYSGMIAYYS